MSEIQSELKYSKVLALFGMIIGILFKPVRLFFKN